MEDFPKLSWSFNQKHLEGWAGSTFQAQGTSGFFFTEHRTWGLELAERKIHETSPPAQTSCGHRGSLLVFPVYITHTTWIYFGLHRAKVHLFKWRKQFLNPTNGKQAILWVIISNKPQYPGNSGRLERNWWDPVCLLLWVTGHSLMPGSCHSSQAHFHPFLWGLCHPFPPIQATKIIKMNYWIRCFHLNVPKSTYKLRHGTICPVIETWALTYSFLQKSLHELQANG